MPGFGLLVPILIVVAVVYAVNRSRALRPAAPGSDARQPRAAGARPPVGPSADVTASPRDGLGEALAGWVAAGLLSEEQSAGILAHEQAAAAAAQAPAVAGPPVAARAGRVPVIAEALGYLGGVLALVGLGLIVAQYWPDMATAGRLAMSGAGAGALLAGGASVREEADPAFARLRWFLWLASTAAAALFAGVLAADALDVGRPTVVLTCAGAVALESGLLWQWRERPLQQLTFLGGVVVFTGALVADITSGVPVGSAVWLVGAAFVVAGLRRGTPAPLLTEGAGAFAVIVGSAIAAGDWQAFGLIFLVATAFGLLALATVPGMAPAKADQLLLGLLGGIALLQGAPGALSYFSRGAGIATGLTTWVIGCALILVGARRLVRLPVVAEVLGSAALIGGGALTGVQWHGFAPVFGLVTAVGLLALGMLPGRVLMSVSGSVGLLVNVPWAISWFFPGEGRAPLLILVSGAMILAVAVLLARMGDRFRRDLGGLRHGRRRPGRRGGILTGHP